MNTQATATQTPAEFVNWNSRKESKVNWNSRSDAPDFYAKRREYHAKALWAMDAAGAAAEGETFSEWKSRKGGR
jgi:hypothetical protein